MRSDSNLQYEPLSITVWENIGCTGTKVITIFDPVRQPYGQATQTPLVGRSMKLSRSLSKHEQLDISSTDSMNYWESHPEYRVTSCYIFLRSYFASDKMTECVDTLGFMCLRLWHNDGLE